LPRVEETLKLFDAGSGLNVTVLGILWIRLERKKQGKNKKQCIFFPIKAIKT
jgi:hypothetical protein